MAVVITTLAWFFWLAMWIPFLFASAAISATTCRKSFFPSQISLDTFLSLVNVMPYVIGATFAWSAPCAKDRRRASAAPIDRFGATIEARLGHRRGPRPGQACGMAEGADPLRRTRSPRPRHRCQHGYAAAAGLNRKALPRFNPAAHPDVSSVRDVVRDPRLNHVEVTAGVLAEECGAACAALFEGRR